MTILDEILEHKREEVASARLRVPPAALEESLEKAPATRGFRRALAGAEPPAVIAEIKRRSPSRGLIRADFDAVAIARAYAEGGAAALSVLTDERYFGGHLDFLRAVRDAVALPLLRKDFVIDAYQIDEARVAGADAVLLIVAALRPEDLAALHTHADARALDALVEVHDEAELDLALEVGARLIGVNNRDLRTFEVDLGVTERVARRLSGRDDVLLVAESGIFDPEDVARLARAGVRAYLVGESLMRQPDVAKALGELRRRM